MCYTITFFAIVTVVLSDIGKDLNMTMFVWQSSQLTVYQVMLRKLDKLCMLHIPFIDQTASSFQEFCIGRIPSERFPNLLMMLTTIRRQKPKTMI